MQLKVLQKIQDILGKVSKENEGSDKEPMADDQRDLAQEPNPSNGNQDPSRNSSIAVIKHLQSLIHAQRSKIEQAQKAVKPKADQKGVEAIPKAKPDQQANDLKAIKKSIGQKRTYADQHADSGIMEQNGDKRKQKNGKAWEGKYEWEIWRLPYKYKIHFWTEYCSSLRI